MPAIGVWRERNGWANQHSVHFKYADGKELDRPEAQYRNAKYIPHFDDLPWKEKIA